MSFLSVYASRAATARAEWAFAAGSIGMNFSRLSFIPAAVAKIDILLMGLDKKTQPSIIAYKGR